ncbi:amino acid transporter AVT1C-like isoform X3 [Malania oleifera]|uniref:amino acid transporter AVT1C-like isoform X3 n=1 Tax=Malania oleifera TaxID=397392 RepID=UPI0025AEAB3F|nr:amino acid transporter AVT1C-like isoform X3 [Malania oleifera]XP_057979170.1 amino acid transporter AVT1C-like isoform X3 [Malania oleifera]
MKNSVSDQSLYIESEEEDEEKEFINKAHDDGNDSDSSNFSAENQQQVKPSSYNTSWPQSYRQSIDLYSSVPSPSIGFLGTPSLSRLGSSFLSSSLTGRHVPEAISSIVKPLLPKVADEHLQQQRPSSHALPPSIPSRKPSIREKPSQISHELPLSRQCSFGQAVLNGMNVLCGVGILSTPYAVKEGGWAGLSLLVIFGLLSYYTGVLLRCCLDSEPDLETYPDIGQAAFGTAGRVLISAILYVELYACCVEYIILESDNLSSLFPNAHLSMGGFELNSHHFFALLTTLAVLPTVWLRDLSVLSYISAGGVVASILVVLCLCWVGLVDEVGFQSKGTTLNLTTLPVAIGLYGYCYSGHAVLPNIYTSMEKRSQYPAVLLTAFGICTMLYAGVAVVGYMMFGKLTESQFTLNMPHNLVASKIAVWTTVCSMQNHICTNHDSSGNESGRVDPIGSSKVSYLFHPHSNSIGDFYPDRGPICPLLWSGDGTDWIFSYNARIIDSSLCLLPEHLEGKSNPFAGITLCIGYRGRFFIISHWNIFRPLQDY